MTLRRLALALAVMPGATASVHARELSREFLTGTTKLPAPVSMSEADLWGVLLAQYVPGNVSNRVEIIANYSREVAARLPVNAIEAAFFDSKAFAAAMQRDPADRGLPSIDASFRYNNGFWAHDVAGYLGCKTPTWVPYMAGFGGINVLLLPNDTIYYYFSDGGTFRWSRAVVEANRIRSICKAVP